MSNSDSFIDEVADEVRRDKLFGYLRRYGWIAVVCVLVLVGGAAWIEYNRSQNELAARATGDALLAALNEPDAAEQAVAIAQIDAGGAAAAVTALLTASSQQDADEIDLASQTLSQLATNNDVPEMYRELAAFKDAMLPTDDMSGRIAKLEQLSQPGQPFRLLALEQLVFVSLESGDTDAALMQLRAIEEDAGISDGLRDRVQTLMVALGEPLPEPVTQ